MLQPMCWTRSRTTLSYVPKNAHAILPDTSNVPLGLSCVTVLVIHSFDSLKFEIKTFIQPFSNCIEGAHSNWCAISDGRAPKIAYL